MSSAARNTQLFSPFARRVWRTIQDRRLIAKGECVLVAVSGGADSMVLLHTLAELRRALKLDLVAAYVDHGLRRGTKRDAALVEKFARAHDVPFEHLVVKVARRASSGRPSLEEAARDARLAALTAAASRLSCTTIALGHSATDQAETVLMWLIRGTGIRGLAGMRPVRAPFVRPLIDLTRDDIRAHATRARIAYRDDPMNADPRFVRTKIRETLLPLLARDFNPRIVLALAALADDFAALNDWLDGATSHRSRISLRDLRALPQPLRDRSVELMAKEAAPSVRLSRTHRDAIARLVMSANGRSRLTLPSLVVWRAGNRLCFRETASNQQVRNCRLAPTS